MKRLQKSRLFFLELMVCMLFFCVCSAICLGVFARAHQMSAQSAAMTHALLRAESAAEAYKTADGDLSAAARWLDGSLDGDTVTIYYDADWQTAARDTAAYVLTISSRDGNCPTAEVRVAAVDDETALCTLDTAVHVGKGAS
jgi:hypothetical protein